MNRFPNFLLALICAAGASANELKPRYDVVIAGAGSTCAGESVASLIGNIARHPR